MIQYFKGLRARSFMKKGIRLLQQEKHEEAIGKFESARKLFPGWSPAYTNISICYFNLNNTEKAIEYVNRALNIEPESQEALYNKAVYLVKADRKDESVAILESLLQKNNKDKESWLQYANITYFNNEHEKSLAAAEEIERRWGADVETSSIIAGCHSHLGNIEKAIDAYSTIIKLDAGQSMAWNNRGYHRTKLSRFNEAIEDLNKAIALRPDFAYAYNNRGFAYLRLGNLSQAIEDIDLSLQLDPENSYAYKNKACYFLETGDKALAKENLLKAASLGYKEKYDNEVDDLLQKMEENNS
jgi:tetratricopeptide (TPR) repeat protein